MQEEEKEVLGDLDRRDISAKKKILLWQETPQTPVSNWIVPILDKENHQSSEWNNIKFSCAVEFY